MSESSAKLSLLTSEYDISVDGPEETEAVHFEPSNVETVA